MSVVQQARRVNLAASAATSTEESSYSTSLGVSPREGGVPLWVVACTLFDPPPVDAADKVVTAAAVLMASTARVHGDLAVKLSPMRLALVCGFERPEKSKWLTDYLQQIGFLTVLDGGVNPKTGRRQARRDAKGRPIDNEFLVFPEPPPHYCGPRTLAEIDALIAEDIAEAELEHERRTKGAKKRSKPRTIPIRRRELFDKSAGQPTLPQGGMDQPPPRGDGDGSAVSAGQPTLPQGGMDQPPPRGDGDGSAVSAGQPTLPPGGAYQIDQRSSISEREIEGSIEPVPGGAAQPPATGQDEARAAAVRELIRRLPWAKWAERRKQTAFRLTPADADSVQAAICQAMSTAGVTLEQAAAIGQAALGVAKSTPVIYVINAFGKHLDGHLRALDTEPLSDDPLPLPGEANLQVSALKPAKQQAKCPVATGPDGAAAPKPVLPACPTCRSEEGETYPSARTVTGADGREQRCPDCLPPAA